MQTEGGSDETLYPRHRPEETSVIFWYFPELTNRNLQIMNRVLKVRVDSAIQKRYSAKTTVANSSLSGNFPKYSTLGFPLTS